MEPTKLYLGIKAAIVQDGKLLLLKRVSEAYAPLPAWWDLPGGRMGVGEDIADTLRRELAEELPGIPAFSVGELLSLRKVPRVLSDGTELCLAYFHVSVPPFEIQLSDEHESYFWADAEFLAGLTGTVGDEYAGLLERVLRG